MPKKKTTVKKKRKRKGKAKVSAESANSGGVGNDSAASTSGVDTKTTSENKNGADTQANRGRKLSVAFARVLRAPQGTQLRRGRDARKLTTYVRFVLAGTRTSSALNLKTGGPSRAKILSFPIAVEGADAEPLVCDAHAASMQRS